MYLNEIGNIFLEVIENKVNYFVYFKYN